MSQHKAGPLSTSPEALFPTTSTSFSRSAIPDKSSAYIALRLFSRIRAHVSEPVWNVFVQSVQRSARLASIT